MVAQLDKEYIRTRSLGAMRRLLSYALFEGRPLTTKGRWINPLVFGLFEIEKKLPQLRKVSKPIFIVGTGRSGTTILGVAMSMHRDVGFLNEPKALWHTIYDREDVSGNYARGPARYRLSADDVTEEIKKIAHRLFAAYLTATFSKRIVDKNQEMIFRVPFVRAIFPDAKFIFLVRNGWDTCYSIDKWSTRKGVTVDGESHDWWGADNRKWKFIVEQLVPSDPDLSGIKDTIAKFDSHIDMAAVEWVLTMREGLRRMKENPNCIFLMWFEDLTAKPTKALSELLDFCELPYDEKFFAYANHVLSPPPAHPQFALHPAIQPAFQQTMEALGYS